MEWCTPRRTRTAKSIGSINGKSEVFFDPKAKYIWALAFAPSGDLYVATGDHGEIYKVTPDGKGSLFFQTEEAHARSMAIDHDGNVIVGTEPSGMIMRITSGRTRLRPVSGAQA